MEIRSESIAAIAPALVLAQTQMSVAVKDTKNPFFKSMYADFNSVREAVVPALNANGIMVMQPIVNGSVRTILIHKSGEFVGCDTPIVVSKDRDAQAMGSAISYSRRYGLSALLAVGSEDDDGESAMGRKAVINYASKDHVFFPSGYNNSGKALTDFTKEELKNLSTKIKEESATKSLDPKLLDWANKAEEFLAKN